MQTVATIVFRCDTLLLFAPIGIELLLVCFSTFLFSVLNILQGKKEAKLNEFEGLSIYVFCKAGIVACA